MRGCDSTSEHPQGVFGGVIMRGCDTLLVELNHCCRTLEGVWYCGGVIAMPVRTLAAAPHTGTYRNVVLRGCGKTKGLDVGDVEDHKPQIYTTKHTTLHSTRLRNQPAVHSHSLKDDEGRETHAKRNARKHEKDTTSHFLNTSIVERTR